MSKDDLLNDLENNLIFLFDLASEHIHFPDLKKDSIRKAVNGFILMDAKKYTTQALKDILNSPDTALINRFKPPPLVVATLRVIKRFYQL